MEVFWQSYVRVRFWSDFWLGSGSPGEEKTIQNHWRVVQNRGLAGSGKVPFLSSFWLPFWVILAPFSKTLGSLGPLGRLQGVHRELWGRSLDIAGVPGGFRDSPGTPPTE